MDNNLLLSTAFSQAGAPIPMCPSEGFHVSRGTAVSCLWSLCTLYSVIILTFVSASEADKSLLSRSLAGDCLTPWLWCLYQPCPFIRAQQFMVHQLGEKLKEEKAYSCGSGDGALLQSLACRTKHFWGLPSCL